MKSNLIPFVALIVSLATFFITIFWRNRAKIGFNQLNDTNMAIILKPDRIDTKTPDVYWNSDFRVIMDVIITNKSALPISIIEFTLNNQFKFNSYTRPSSEYTVTLQATKVEQDGMVTHYGGGRKRTFPIEDTWLQPMIDIPPYTSLRGHLLFRFNDKSDVHIGNNTLRIITSRKTFSFQVKITEELFSVAPSPEEVRKVRDSNLF
ncbi:hypothetical protein [Bacillus cereus]|uniref:hypothetical protein n=1 Tax=Bacillus cereus TaxID=1396 RepID=UPI0020D24F49|nr:hypothetical protein [Bacillus cereus]